MGDFFDAIDISASALSAERLRLNTISSNLANAETTRTPEGGPYRRKDIVFEAIPKSQSFDDALRGNFTDPTLHQVRVSDIVSDQGPAREVYQPNHPDANAQGIVSYPNVNAMEEMVNLITASRSYEANVTAMKTAQHMMNKALEIGRK